MNDFINKNIVLFKNGLETYIQNLKNDLSSFNIIETDINEVETAIDSISKNLKREDLLLIANYDYLSGDTLSRINELFKKQLNIDYPHILYVYLDGKNHIETDSLLIFNENFNYFLSDNEIAVGKLSINEFTMKLIFKQIRDIKIFNDYIVDSFKMIVDSKIAIKQKEKIEKLYETLQVTSKIDSLTGVLDRRAFFEAIEKERKKRQRDVEKIHTIKDVNELLMCFMMIDLDNFKTINDTYGHQVGDHVLEEIGKLFYSHSLLRENDIIGRYGGEEFGILLVSISLKDSKVVADRIRNKLKSIGFCYNNEIFHVSVSIGISKLLVEDDSINSLIQRADKALYKAKADGKDKTVIFEEMQKEN